MGKLFLAAVLFVISQSAFSGRIPDLRPLSPSLNTIQEDFNLILSQAGLEGKVKFVYIPGSTNEGMIVCSDNTVTVEVTGDHQWSQTFYMSLQRLGFLFPHPRMQISPTLSDIRNHCGKSYRWNPVTKYHGFHLHTQHPNEWVHGFLLGKKEIAFDFVRWIARNQQNIFDLTLLRQKESMIFRNLREPFQLAKDFGIHAGVTLGAALHQQNGFKLVSILGTFSDRLSLKQINKKFNRLLDNVDVSFVNMEMGTSEFTAVNYPRMIKWMNLAAEIVRERNIALVVKVHVSTNQHHAHYGNFNFLPQYADPGVGILPHTVYMYGLSDDSAPMYGNKDFKHILNFMLQEKDKRRTWFYPETSYFIALDIDAPLLLTDYLLTRANDTRILYDNNIEGQLNFTTGHEVGYWLFDWTYALLNNKDYNFDPMIGLKLMGEDVDSWKRIIDFQNEFFKNKELISIVSFQNFGDEFLPGTHQTLKRNPLKKLYRNKELLKEEIERLEEALAHMPKDLKIKNRELRNMLEITFLRVEHALKTRQAFLDKENMNEYLREARDIRMLAQERVNDVMANQRYPEALIFERHKNPTSYPYGYAYTVKNLHYWVREEEVIRRKKFSPFFMNITDFLDIVF